MSDNVLQLNASFEPIRVISFQKAVTMMVAGRAQVVEADPDRMVRSPSSEWPWPSVIRLTTYVKVPFERNIALNRTNVLNRDNFECAYCTGRRATTIDHIHPRSKGGAHRWENVIAACRPCNNKKDDKLLSEIGWILAFQPKIPSGHNWLLVGINDRKSWAKYLNLT